MTLFVIFTIVWLVYNTIISLFYLISEFINNNDYTPMNATFLIIQLIITLVFRCCIFWYILFPLITYTN